MNIDPRHHEEYDSRQVEVAHRVLINIGPVLGPFRDCLVLVGGWYLPVLEQGRAAGDASSSALPSFGTGAG